MPIRVCYRDQSFKLVPGSYVIGRSPSCQIIIDEARVSRRHALLLVRKDQTSIEDLGSRNGVFVDGKPISGRYVLRSGQVISVGRQDISVFFDPDDPTAQAEPVTPVQSLKLGERIGGVQHFILTTVAQADSGPEERTAELPVLIGLAERAIAAGDAIESRGVLERPLSEVLASLRGGFQVDADLARFACYYAVRLASVTGDPYWIDYVFDMYTLLDELIPKMIVEALEDPVDTIRGVDRKTVRNYAQRMNRRSTHFTPAEREVFQRVLEIDALVHTRRDSTE